MRYVANFMLIMFFSGVMTIWAIGEFPNPISGIGLITLSMCISSFINVIRTSQKENK